MIDLKSDFVFKLIIFIFAIGSSGSISLAQASASAPVQATRAVDLGASRCDGLLNTFMRADARRPGQFLAGQLVMDNGRSAPTTSARGFEQSVEIETRLADRTKIQERLVFSRTALTAPSNVVLRIQRTDAASTSQGVSGLYLEAAQTQAECSLTREGTIQRSPPSSSITTVDLSFDQPFCQQLIAKLPSISAALGAAPNARCQLENGSVETSPDDCAYRMVAGTYEAYNRRLSRSLGTRGSENFQLSRYMDYPSDMKPRTSEGNRSEYAVMRGAIHSCQTPGAPVWPRNFLSYLERLAGSNANFSFRPNRPSAPAGVLAPVTAPQAQ